MFDKPKPASVYKPVDPEVMKSFGSVDKLVQVIIPKLIDKINMQEWERERLAWQCSSFLENERKATQDALKNLADRLDDLALRVEACCNLALTVKADMLELQNRPAPTKTRRKAAKSVPVVPEEVCGFAINAALLKTVEDMGEAATCPVEVRAFLNALTEDEKTVVRGRK